MNNLTFNYNNDINNTDIRKNYLRNKVSELINTPQPIQRTPEWYKMRDTMITASDWAAILGESEYSNKNKVLLKKCGEDTFYTSKAIEWGVKYEKVATMIYELRNNIEVLEFGVLRHPTIHHLGASPDGITRDGIMLEIKCPMSRTITGEPPKYYWCQVQGQLEVCELDRCDFLECGIKEYDNENDYLNDNNINYEKGVVAEIYDKYNNKFFFEYSPININNNDYNDWKNNILHNYNNDNYLFSCFSYWYLNEVSCVPIYRNMDWFNKIKGELEEFWNLVLYYRNLGLNKLKEDLNKNKKSKRKKNETISIYLNNNQDNNWNISLFS